LKVNGRARNGDKRRKELTTHQYITRWVEDREQQILTANTSSILCLLLQKEQACVVDWCVQGKSDENSCQQNVESNHCVCMLQGRWHKKEECSRAVAEKAKLTAVGCGVNDSVRLLLLEREEWMCNAEEEEEEEEEAW
jgi:hypothetical protein